MSETHSIPIRINYGKNTLGFFALTEPKTLVVFVHGFGGDTLSTFNDFHNLIPKTKGFERVDYIFYGYESKEAQVDYHAAEYFRFIDSVTRSKNVFKNKSRKLSDNFQYEKIVFVAHSLGSLIVRRAIISGYTAGCFWVNNLKMVLFAPAHSGARIQGLILESLPGITKLMGGIGLFVWPILDDLRKGSNAIETLRSDTLEVLRLSKNAIGKASTIIIGGSDKIVFNIPFIIHDPVAIPVKRMGHKEICKPKGNYKLPILEILKLI